MTDQTIPANLTRKEAQAVREWAELAWSTKVQDAVVAHAARVLLAVLPPRPTLADMTLDEQDECTGMQADLAQGDRVVILDGTPDAAGLVQVLEKSLDVYRAYPAEVTPRPDLPRLEWTGNQKPASAPALPDGFRLADHKDHGRVMVTTPTPNIEGSIYYVLPVGRNLMGFDWRSCDPDMLTYLDQEDDTSDAVPESTLSVGTVIESADDPRLAALPLGIILLDREGDPTTKRRGVWTGPGYPPIPSEDGTFGPWTVLHIPKEADQ